METMNVFEDNFDMRKISPNTWVIGTKYPATPWGCDCYLLEGDDACILIDSGMSKLNIHDYIIANNVTDKPIIAVINTHSHFDHTGGNGYFPKVYMAPAAEKGAKRSFGGALGGSDNSGDYPLDYEITPVKEGDIIDLKGRPLEIYDIPAHDVGSIAILDRTNRMLFTGDELETGWCNVNVQGNPTTCGTIENHHRNMVKLYSLYDAFDWICPGHHGMPVDKSTLLEILHADEMILSGHIGTPEIPKKAGPMAKIDGFHIVRYKSAHLGFNVKTIFDDPEAHKDLPLIEDSGEALENARALNLFEEHFDSRKIADKTWAIGTKYPATPMGCDCYLLEGDDECILIDTGMSKLNIHEYIKAAHLTDKPITATISTHSHFDHTGGNGYFDKVYMNPIAEKGAKSPFEGNKEDYPLDYEITPVHEGDVIPLKGRPLEIYEIGAHNAGSIAILDRTNRMLYSGDELETGWCNISMSPVPIKGSSVEQHYKNMQKLYSLYDAFDRICPGHHGAPVDKSTLLEIMHCDELILSGLPGDPDVPVKCGPFKGIEGFRVMRYKSAHLGYNEHSIFESEDALENTGELPESIKDFLNE